MVGDNKKQNKTKQQNKSVLGATLALSSSWAELQVGAKVNRYLIFWLTLAPTCKSAQLELGAKVAPKTDLFCFLLFFVFCCLQP